MKAYVITHSSTYETRAEAVGRWLKEQGADVTWIYADFDHRELKTVYRREPDHVYLHMEPYAGNLTPRRIRSIQGFAGEVEKYLTGRTVDLLYFMIPANSFAHVAARLKKQTGALVVFDIIDLWPESLPLPHVSKLPPAYIWKQLRDRHIGCADRIFTECGLYQEVLQLPQDRTQTLYWFREESTKKETIQNPEETEAEETEQKSGKSAADAAPETENIDPAAETQDADPGEEIIEKFDDGCVHIAYLGAINNIIDIEAIAGLLKLLQRERPVVVDVIGYGKRKETFLKALDEAGVQSEDYGAVYNEEEKEEIFRNCSFGINMMVPQVRVGLTMKSLDYLANGLPLLNNIAGDTWQLVEEYDAGINIPREDPETVIPKILAMLDDPLAGRDARRLYEEKLTEQNFRETLQKTLKPLVEKAAARKRGIPDPANHGIPARQKRQTSGSARNNAGAGKASGKRISVAMAACNGEKYLPEQLDTILPQLDAGDEVIVSVDPSQDRTFEILFEYAAKDPRIRVLEGPGKGVIRNVENALQSCSGQMIFLADQDDVWMTDKVEKVCKALEHNTLVLHDAEIVDENLQETAASFMRWRKSRKGMLANIRKNSYIGCCMAFRRELLEQILPFPENLPMHDQWIGLLAEKYGSVRLLRIPLIRYRRHGNNATKQTHANPAQMLKWRAEITREVLRR